MRGEPWGVFLCHALQLAAGQSLAEPTRLRQLLINQLSNAIKFNRQGEQVWVEAPPKALGWYRA